MEFKWHYLGEQPRRLRSVFRSFGVTNSLLKVAIFHGGQMRINDRVAWAIDQVEPGDVVYLVVPNEPANPTITVSDQTFEIAYEDEDFLVINKEAGVATVPAHHVAVQDSLVNRVKGYYQRQNYPNQVTHVATRLDKDSGFSKAPLRPRSLRPPTEGPPSQKRVLGNGAGEVNRKSWLHRRPDPPGSGLLCETVGGSGWQGIGNRILV